VWDPWTFTIHAKNPGEQRVTVEEGASYVGDVMRDKMVFVVDPHANVRGRVGKAILRATMTAAAKKRIVDLVEHGIGMDFSGPFGRSLQRAAAKQAADEAKYLQSLSRSRSRSRSGSRSRSSSRSPGKLRRSPREHSPPGKLRRSPREHSPPGTLRRSPREHAPHSQSKRR